MDQHKSIMIFLVSLLAFILLGFFATGLIDSITLTSPANTTVTNNATPAFRFITIGNTSTTNCTLYLNGTAYGSNESVDNTTETTIAANATIPDGIYLWTMNCTDPDAMNMSQENTLTIDTINPAITSDPSTTPSGNYSQNYFFVNITCNDTNHDRVLLYINGTPENFTNNDSTIFWSNRTVADGTYIVSAWCNDSATHTNQTENFTYVLDTNPVIINAITITPDRFVCAIDGSVNNNFTISVNATDTNLAWVNANISSINATAGLVTLSLQPSGLYENTILVANTSGLNFSSRNITLSANDTAGNNFAGENITTVLLYNFTRPTMINPATQFTNTTTNLCDELDFTNINYVIEIAFNGTAMSLPWDDFRKVVTLNFSAVNFTNTEILAKVQNLPQYLNATITTPGDFGDSTIYVDSENISALSTNTTIAFYGLPFSTVPGIVGATITNITPDTPYNISGLLIPRINLTFTVEHFSQYNITDTTPPTITFNTPEVNYANYSSTSKLLNVTINGTGTRLSDIVLTLDGTIRLHATGANTTLNCTSKSAGGDIVECTYNATSLSNAEQHTFVVNATDYGSTAGNNNNATRIFGIDWIAPIITVTSPRNTTYYTTQPIRINISAADEQNHHDKLWYNTSTNATTILCTNATSITLTNGTYTYYFYANDTFGNNATMIPVTFIVNQTSSSQQLVNTTATNISANTTTTTIIIPTDNNNISTITTTTTDTTTVILDLSQRMNATNYTTISSGNVTLTRDGDYAALIPAGTTITGSGWNGLFILPTVQSASSYTVSGGDVDVVITLGSNTSLTLSQAIKIILTGQHDKKAGIATSGTTLTEIATECTSATNASNIVGNGECYYDDGDDLIIWTKHLTVFGSFTEDTVSSGSSGGSGSGYIAPDPLQTFSYALLKSGPTTVTVSNNNLPLTSFVFATTTDVANAKIVITRVTTPATPFVGTVYKYVRIDHANISDAIITGAKLSFKIEKSWFTTNKINKTQIVLYRYTTAWTMLTTTLVNEDATHIYYEAQSPGLSLFAIVFGAKQTTAPIIFQTITPLPPTTTPTGNTITTPEPAATTSPTPAATPPIKVAKKSSGKSSSLGWLWILAGIVLVAIILYFVFYQRQE